MGHMCGRRRKRLPTSISDTSLQDRENVSSCCLSRQSRHMVTATTLPNTGSVRNGRDESQPGTVAVSRRNLPRLILQLGEEGPTRKGLFGPRVRSLSALPALGCGLAPWSLCSQPSSIPPWGTIQETEPPHRSPGSSWVCRTCVHEHT